MNTHQADIIMSTIIAGTSGWQSASDETVELYVAAVRKWVDWEAAQAAATRVVETWAEARRPPIATLLDVYRDEMRKRAMSNVRQLPGPRTVEFAEGRRIAGEAYLRQCQQDGREPNWEFFETFTAGVKERSTDE